MTERQEKLLTVVKKYHGDQKRKYTGDPYWTHLWSVARLVKLHADAPLAFEIALCHDLFEDTKCKPKDLYEDLLRLGFDHVATGSIVGGVIYLTDLYTSYSFPCLNRRVRKEREATRLGRTPDYIQSIKYADLIDNTFSIVRYDPKFAKIYLSEKRMYLDHMRKGNIDLFLMAAWSLQSGLRLLEADLDAETYLRSSPNDPLGNGSTVPHIQSESELPTLGHDLD